jgi:hypothetical protein
MIKVIFTEIYEEFSLPLIIGEIDIETDIVELAHQKANVYAGVLSEVRGKKVSHMLQRNGGIIAKLEEM